MRSHIIPLFCALSGLVLSTGLFAADGHTQVIAATCMACHGPGGNSRNLIPRLAGLPKDQFVQTMKAFQTGEREATIMRRHAAGYTDAEIDALGIYFSALK